MFALIQELVFGYHTVDLKSEFDRRSLMLEQAEEAARKDPNRSICVKNERRILHGIQSRLDHGEKTLKIERGKSLYSALYPSSS